MTRRSLSRELDRLALLREPTRRALYEYVQERSTGVGRDEAAEAVGIGRALAAFHLDRLVEAGLLRAGYLRLSGRAGPGAGRPSKLYRRSRRRVDVTVPRRQFELLAGLLAASAVDPAKRDPKEAAEEVGRALGVRASRRLRTPPSEARLGECVESVLDDLGFEPFRDSPREIRSRNCPFDPLSRRYEGAVCGAGVAVVAGVVAGLGASHLTVSRDEQPERCCVVVTSSASRDSSAPIQRGSRPRPKA